MTNTDPSKRPLWFFRKKTILVFLLASIPFMIMGAYRANELYAQENKFGTIHWNKILEPVLTIGGIPIMIYVCIVLFWLLFRLKRELNEMLGIDDWKSRQ